jgi:tellurite resistance protein TerC
MRLRQDWSFTLHLRNAVSKFDYLPQGIAIVLIFIGVKMLAEHWINQWVDKTTQVFISLGFIVVCLAGSVFYSIFIDKKAAKKPPAVYYDDAAH